MAIWLDGEDLPQLAKFFYRQSLEEREHALMMVQYKLDRGHKVEIPAVPAVKNDFENVQEIVDMSLAQEKVVTGQIELCSPQHALRTTHWASSSSSGS